MAKKSGSVSILEKELSPILLSGIGAVLAAIYFGYSFFSDGFYQHDEAGHYLNMREFWHDPSVILGNWPKPGYKLIYVLPSLLGPTFVTLFNSAVAAATVCVSYLIARELKLKYALGVILLMATQPLWIQLSFRNYSEIISALLLAIAVYYAIKEKHLPAALLISYLTAIRQEVFIIAAVYGVFLLYKREWVSAFSLAAGPLLVNIAGWASNGDPFYLITSTLSTSEAYKDAYARQGFFHYFKTSIVIWGPFVVTGFIFWLTGLLKKKVKPNLYLIVPIVIYLSIHLVFNIKSFKIGASTGGNLRYMLFIAPLMSVLALQGFEKAKEILQDKLLLGVIGAVVVLIGIFMTYDHNNIFLLEDRNWMPLVWVVLTVVLFYFLTVERALMGLFLLLAIHPFVTIEPFERTQEDQIMAQVAQWALGSNVPDRPVVSQHIMLRYFMGMPRNDFPKGNETMRIGKVQDAPIGSLIFWESHYSYRPRLREDSVPLDYLRKNTNAFRPVKQFVTPNQRFGLIVFEKIGEAPELSAQAD